MKKAIITFTILLLATGIKAQSFGFNETDSIVKRFSEDADSLLWEFEEYSKSALEEYERCEAEMLAEYSNYENSIKQMWGGDTIVDDTPSEWIEYSNDFKSRSIVNFESGNVSVEVVLDGVDENNPEEVERLLTQAIVQMLESKGNATPYSTKGKETALTDSPILDNLIDLSKYNIEKSAEAVAPKNSKKRKTPPSPTVRGKELEFADDKASKEEKREGNKEEERKIAETEKELKVEADRIAEVEKEQQQERERIAEVEKRQQQERERIAEAEKIQQQEKERIAEAERRNREEAKRIADIKNKQREENLRLIAEAKKKQEEEARKIAEAKKREEEARKIAEAKKQEEEERKIAEAKRQEEERKIAEAKKKQEEEERKIAEAKRKQEEEEREIAEAKRKQEEEEKRIAEAKRKQQEEEKRIAEAKRKQQEEETRLAEAKKKQEEEKKKSQPKKEQPANKEDIAKAIAKQSPKSTTTVKGNDNKERKVVKVEMALVSDNLSKSAALYKDIVTKHSKKFEIEEPLIFAVMEQESHFNPEAKSWIPAYGLMQLVPKSGGYDAYRYVHKRDWIPTMDYLYVPHQNIELGTAYLRILTNMFKNVKDAECRRLCVIAGYNTGAGNVCRAFTGKTSIKGAVEHINKYSYEELYDYLTKKLSTDEARKYVSGVSKKREKYLKK